MADDLRNQLERNLAMFEGAGMDEDAKAVKKRLAELDKAAAPAPEPAPKKTTTKKVEEN